MSTRIALLEDDPRYRAGLADLLSVEPGFEVVAVFDAVKPFLEAVREEEAPWDLVISDLGLPDGKGVDAIREVKRVAPTVTVVAVTVFEDPDTILEAICAGADGYLLKRTGAEEVVAQIRVVLAGGSPLTPAVAKTVVGLLRGPHAPVHAPGELDLSEREREVLRLLAEGLLYKQVAAALELSVETVKTYVRRIYRKLQVQTVAQAVHRAMRRGQI
ncbi:MAG TPA: response regulator transcription factor [Candidatus Polarisedimenticolaceae bacterium]